jgi:aromatic-L-amino-acid decarboxylase
VKPTEFTLDPSDWNEFRSQAHGMLDDMLNHLCSISSQSAWQPIPEDVRTALKEPLPLEPQGVEQAYGDFRNHVLPYSNGNAHPRFFGWVQGNGIPLAMMADMLASGMNPHMAGFNQSPAIVEHQVIAWLAELMGMPGASGVLASGGTMANLMGLAVARHAKAGFDVRKHGIYDQPRLVVYASTETHSWAKKSVELFGLGTESLHLIPVDSAFGIRPDLLQAAIAEDRRAGKRPICVIGNAGTVNTAAIDDLAALADICCEQDLWFHVDGAFGALATLSTALRPLLSGMKRADSLAFDLHKWMYLPFECACLLVRDAETHRATFASSASYLAQHDRGVIAGGLPFADRGIELTRGFKALKIWMSLKAYGVNAFTRVIQQNVEQARYLAELVTAHPDLEVLAPVSLNIVCFRFAAKGVDEDELNRINREALLRLQESGTAVPSSTSIDGKFAIRCAIVNHRSRTSDFDLLVEKFSAIASELLASRTTVSR